MIDPVTLLRAQESGLPAAETHPDPPLVSFPLRLDWERTLPPAGREPWPDPELVNREVAADGKTAVRDLVVLAQAHGWTAVVTQARGAWPGVAGRPTIQRESLAVRLNRGDERAVAVYVEAATGRTWAWDALWAWRAGQFPQDHDAAISLFLDRLFGLLCKSAMPTDWSCPYFGPMHGPKRAPRGKASAEDS